MSLEDSLLFGRFKRVKNENSELGQTDRGLHRHMKADSFFGEDNSPATIELILILFDAFLIEYPFRSSR